MGTHTFQIQHCSTSFNIPVQIQFNKGTKNKFFTSLVLCKRMNGKIQSKHQAWGALVERHHWFQCSQCMSVSVGGTEVMSRGDSAVIGCLWEEAILLASGSRSVSMWISLTENMWKDVQMERQKERETESLANVHGQLYLSEPFSKSSFKRKNKLLWRKREWRSARPAHNKENAQKGFGVKTCFLAYGLSPSKLSTKALCRDTRKRREWANRTTKTQREKGRKEGELRRKGYRKLTETEWDRKEKGQKLWNLLWLVHSVVWPIGALLQFILIVTSPLQC